MILLRLLNGSAAGSECRARRFPLRVGRAARSDLPLSAEGVWENHFEVLFRAGKGYLLRANPQAPTWVEETAVSEVFLRNGDVITAGAARLQFWLAEVPQAGLAWREWLTWLGVAGISLLQVGLIYWLRA